MRELMSLVSSDAESDIVGVAIPLFQQGKPQGSIGVYLPVSRFKAGKRERIIASLHAAAERIDRSLNAESIPAQPFG